ncbi:Hypothetical protein SMAX5B_017417, partial [Scophthalmus maximus]
FPPHSHVGSIGPFSGKLHLGAGRTFPENVRRDLRMLLRNISEKGPNFSACLKARVSPVTERSSLTFKAV